MARRSKKRPEPEAEKPAKIPEKLARPFADAMRSLKDELAQKASEAEASDVKPTAPKPEPPRPAGRPSTPPRPGDPVARYGYDDRAAFHQAFADVRPLARQRRQRSSGQAAPISRAEADERAAVAARLDEAESNARARLDALVAGSVHFVVEKDGDAVYGRRSDMADRTIDALLGIKTTPAISIDLHGLDAKAARVEVVTRLREEAKRGPRDLIIVHGKGLHSDGGVGVLADVVFDALTHSAASPDVGAFATAPIRFGGNGATLVRLVPKRS